MPENFDFIKPFNPEIIIKHLNKIRTIDNGNVAFSGFDFDEWITVLISSLYKSNNVNNIQFRRAIHAALFNIALPNNFTTEQLAKEYKKQLSKIVHVNKNKYTVFFQIMNFHHFIYKSMRINDTQMHFYAFSRKNFRKSARNERAKLYENIGRHFDIPESKNFEEILVDVDANNPAEAHHIAKNSISYIRGLLNFSINKAKFSRRSTGSRRPVNEILEFPFTTVHNRDGSLVYDGFWYTPNWISPTHSANFKKKYDLSLSKFCKLDGLVRKNYLESDARAAIIQYCDALDESDWQSSFLKLWTLLEFLTYIGNAGYDKLVKRASRIYSDNTEAREILKHLRVRRNQIVHENSSEDDLEILIYQTKRFAEDLLLLFINNVFKFECIEDFARFLDSPVDASERRRQGKVLRAADRFWG